MPAREVDIMNERLLTSWILALTAALGGCAAPSGPISLSISELGSEVQEDGGSLFAGIRHRRSHNVSGLGSIDAVGMLSADPDPPLIFRWPTLFSRPTLPDQLAPRISSQCSRVAVHDMPMSAGKGIKEVLALRDSLDALQALEVPLQRSRMVALLLAEIVAGFEGAPAAAATPASASEAAAPASAASAGAPSGAGGQRADAAAALRPLLVEAWQRLASGSEAPADGAGWKGLQKLHGDEHSKLQKDYEAALATFRAARKEQGLIVARWNYEASKQGGLAAIGFNVAGRQAQTRSGFVVMGHPRTLTLISGDDLMARACSTKDAQCEGAKANTRNGIDSMIPARRLYTTTFQLLAQHLAWAESGSIEQQMALKAQLGEIVKAISAPGLESLKSKLEALSVDVGYAARSVTSGENLGAVSGSVHWEVPFTFWQDEAYARSVEYIRALNGNFLRVSSMRTTLDAYASRYGGKLPEKIATQCLGMGPSAEDVVRATRAHLACDRLQEPEFVRALDATDVEHRRERCAAVGQRPASQTASFDAG
jgi:hypothetical protein